MRLFRFVTRTVPAMLATAVLCLNLTACVPVVAGGATSGGLMAADRRTSGAYIEDQTIEFKTERRIGDQLGDKIHVNVTSYNRNVLLSGEAADESTKAQAETIAKAAENVRSVTNELAIGMITAMTSRGNDSYITSMVKGRMIRENRFPPIYVKVITENSVVYLMGMVTHKEAEDAVDIARSTDGVEKVVKVFEYID